MIHQFRRDPTSVSLNSANIQQNVIRVFAILKPGFVGLLVDVLKLIGIREAASASLIKSVAHIDFQSRAPFVSFSFRSRCSTNFMTNFEMADSYVFPLNLLLAGMSFHFHELGTVLSTSKVRTKPPRTVFPTRGQQLYVRTKFVQEEPLDLQCLTMILAIWCRGRRIQKSGHSDFGILSNFGASSILTWVQADTASADFPAQSGSLAVTSVTFAAVS